MANPNPYKARLARKARPTVSLRDAITALDEIVSAMRDQIPTILELEDIERRVAALAKLAHALSQSASSLARVVEVGEYEARLEEMHDAIEATREALRADRVRA